MKIKKYEPLINGTSFMGMTEVKEGRWVKYSDIIEFLEELKKPLSCKGCVNMGHLCTTCIRNATTDHYED